ncbi:MAG TPA: acyl-CoA thioesterase [Usitatibacteraceae bacterium]|nr:acyl-CoA thioesterase [Usitatibacteraceae bacterium]
MNASPNAADAPYCEVVTLPTDRQPVLRIIPMPADTNAHGTIFGGWVMAQVDLAGSVPAVQRARGKVVTVSVNSFQFKQAVLVGDLVSFYAEVVKVGRTSITVDVVVYAQRQRYGTEVVKVTEAQLTYVAIDDQRKPRMVPEE